MKKIIPLSIAVVLLLAMTSISVFATAQNDYSHYQHENDTNEPNEQNETNNENADNTDSTDDEPTDPNWILWGISSGVIVGICFIGFAFVASGRTKKSKNEDGELDQE